MFMEFLPQAFSLVFGYIAKLFAIHTQNKSEEQKLLISAAKTQETFTEHARKYDTPAAAANRRIIIWFLFSLLTTMVIGYAIFDVPIWVESVVIQPSYLFGLIPGSTEIVWTELKGIVAYKEFFTWISSIVSMYFGSWLAKGR